MVWSGEKVIASGCVKEPVAVIPVWELIPLVLWVLLLVRGELLALSWVSLGVV